MNFNEYDLLRGKTEVLNLKLSKLPSAKVLFKLEFDTKDQVLFFFFLLLSSSMGKQSQLLLQPTEVELGLQV